MSTPQKQFFFVLKDADGKPYQLPYIDFQKVQKDVQEISLRLANIEATVHELQNRFWVETTPLRHQRILDVLKEKPVKSFSDTTGHYEIIIDFPENDSASILVQVFKTGYEDILGLEGWREQPLPHELQLISQEQHYLLWGYVTFDPIILRSHAG